MAIDEGALADVQAARARVDTAEAEVAAARAEYHRAIRRLHLAGASLREMAEVLELSHQRLHQIVGEDVATQVLRRLAKQTGDAPMAAGEERR